MNLLSTRYNLQIFYRKFSHQLIRKKKLSNIFDVAIIGGGAAGMSAAIHGRFDGFKIAVFEERSSKGGNFSNTPIINNLPGYPLGISGASLSESTIQQFQKLGGRFFSSISIKEILKKDSLFLLRDQNKNIYFTKTIILATGVAYRKLGFDNETFLEGKGLYYEVDDTICNQIIEEGTSIYIYGGGNSAGQAAVFYRSLGARVVLMHRNDSLKKSMSQYLIDRMELLRCEILPNTTLKSIEGEQKLTSIKIQNLISKENKEFKTNYLFIMIGGVPKPLPKPTFSDFVLDDRGYIKVNGFLKRDTSLETNIEGIYAAGDITSIGAGRIQLAQAHGVMAIKEAINSTYLKE